MQYIFNQSWKISTPKEWLQKFENSKKNEDGRSAKALAEFCNSYDAENRLTQIISDIIGMDVTLETAFPEYQTHFDSHGKGRMHDLAIKGHTADGKSIFIGIEAKVNEEFSATTISKYYKKMLAKREKGESTELPERVEELIKKYYPKLSTNSNVKYQLSYALGSVAVEEADIRLFLVLTFLTEKYLEECGIKNHKAFEKFMEEIGAKQKKETCYDVNLNGIRVIADYRTIKP